MGLPRVTWNENGGGFGDVIGVLPASSGGTRYTPPTLIVGTSKGEVIRIDLGSVTYIPER